MDRKNVTDAGAADRLLRRWRKAEGYTLVDVASVLGVDESTLSRIERGVYKLGLRAKVSVARRLGVSVEKLFEVEPIDALAPITSGDEATR